MDDSIYPNDGALFSTAEPPDQDIARKKEKANTLEALPILQEILSHLEERIAFYGSVDSIPDAVKKDPAEFMHIFSANKLAKDNLIVEKEYIAGLLEDHAPNL